MRGAVDRPIGLGSCVRRRGGAVTALVVLACAIPAPARSQQARYTLGAEPEWVRPIALDRAVPPPAGPVTEGFEVLLVDRQEAVLPSGHESYRHVAYRLLDEGAVQDHSQIEIDFDPLYERITLHAVTVWRDGRAINQLQSRRIRVSQRESQADYQIYDGSLSLDVLLEDVRRGDIVEYSYTRRGANPVFGDHYMSAVTLQETVPLHRLEFRVLWPRGRPLFVRPRRTEVRPTVRDDGAYREYVWRVHDVPAELLDADLPSWYDALPEIQLSDFASWAAVAAWGDSLFPVNDAATAALAGPLADIRAAHPDTLARVLAALRFVQDEIRYLGVEIGVNSHQPYPPAVVLRRRYGDCKDKALLFVTLLRALGVSARPALVSTSYGSHLAAFQPTAALFDHVVVVLDLDGGRHWVDPTALYERGGLDDATPLFGAALVLGGGADSLVAIPDVPAAHPVTDVTVSMTLRGADSAATMRVNTRYSSQAADDVRASVRATSAVELQRRYQDYYARLYPAIRSEAPPTVEDDDVANVLRTTERYEVPEFWHQSSSGEGIVGTFEPLEGSLSIPPATSAARTMPLAVAYPVHIRYTIEARIASGWSIRTHSESLETAAARFRYGVEAHGDVLRLTYEYETLADHVAPERVPDHQAKLARARKLLSFSVMPPASGAASAKWTNPDELNWSVLLAASLALLLSLFGAFWVVRHPPPAWPRGPADAKQGPTGLGGWLILVGIGAVVTPIRLAVSLVQTGPTYSASSWARLTSPGTSAYHPLWAPALLFELLGHIVLFVFSMLLVWQFFRRRPWFPALFVLFILSRTVFLVLDGVFVRLIPALADQADPAWTPQWQAVAVSVIWVSYMFRSRRVQNTFMARTQTAPAAEGERLEPAGTVPGGPSDSGGSPG